MIISRTPLRLALFSGGSDLPAFYQKEKGAALSVTIDKYIDVMVRSNPFSGIRTIFDQIDEVNDISEMKHTITKEALKEFNLSHVDNLTIASMSDINCSGSGLGSSSAFTIGLSKALHEFNNDSSFPKSYFAEKACRIEMERCNYPVGKQDQYAAAYGGFNLFEFKKDGTVNVTTPSISIRSIHKMESNMLLIFSGKSRSANDILQKQATAMANEDKFNLVRKSRDLAYVGKRYLEEDKIDDFGDLLHSSWLDKKAVVKEISPSYFDEIYNFALENGAIGGKLLGAGGGGFFLFYCSSFNKKMDLSLALKKKNSECQSYPFHFTDIGSSIIYKG